jgi:hypothetical protein
MKTNGQAPRLLIAFPKSETELRAVFSEPVDSASAENRTSYATRRGLGILGARVDPGDPRRVSLETEPMNGAAMEVDVLQVTGVQTRSGQRMERAESPEFIQGIASIAEIQRPVENRFPFASKFIGKVAAASCGKDGGVDSNVLIDTFGFAFIHMQTGGPFNSLKIVTKGHIPGILEATRQLRAGLTTHVLWAGGEIRNVDGETQLVDTGFMEGSIIPPTPLKSPPPYPIKAAELAGEAGKTLRAKSFQGVIVRFDEVTIDGVCDPDKAGLRIMQFHDGSGGQLSAVLLHTVTAALGPGQKLRSLRGLLHQPRAGELEAIVELDEHLVYADR